MDHRQILNKNVATDGFNRFRHFLEMQEQKGFPGIVTPAEGGMVLAPEIRNEQEKER